VVVVSHPGLLWLVRGLVPAGTQVTAFVPAGSAPETFEPTPSSIATLSKADFFIASAVPFETAWLPRIKTTAPQLIVVESFPSSEQNGLNGQTPQDQKEKPKKGSSSKAQLRHGHDHHHDPHLWLAPRELRQAAVRIAAALEQRIPAEGTRLRLGNVLEDLGALEGEISAELSSGKSDDRAGAPKLQKSFFVFHPAWGAFAEQFGLEQHALEDLGHSPGPAHMQRFVTKMKADQSQVVFVQPQMSTREAKVVARLAGAEVVTVDPLAEDLPQELRRMARLLRDDFASRERRATQSK
jgi:zinc transport system substrate-binding protein